MKAMKTGLIGLLLAISACGTSRQNIASSLQDNTSSNSIQLRANDGTQIDVGYWISRNNIGEGLGSFYVVGINDLAVHLSNSGRDSTVVITVNDAYSISCAKDDDGWFHINQHCRFGARDEYDNRMHRDDFWQLYSLKSGHGLYEVNHFHLSVVRDGIWLTEDIPNGSHNFKLEL